MAFSQSKNRDKGLQKLKMLDGKWKVYDEHSNYNALNLIRSSIDGKSIFEHFKRPDGEQMFGCIQIDPVTKQRNYIWGKSNDTKQSNSENRVFKEEPNEDEHLVSFTGQEIFQGETIIDRISFNLISNDTVQKIYEISRDNGEKWVLVYQYNLKKIN